MKYQICSIRILLLVIILSPALIFCCCKPGNIVDIIIENQTDQVLILYLGLPKNNTDISRFKEVGTISPGRQITVKKADDGRSFPITALNIDNNVVFQAEFTSENITYLHEKTYKITIPRTR